GETESQRVNDFSVSLLPVSSPRSSCLCGLNSLRAPCLVSPGLTIWTPPVSSQTQKNLNIDPLERSISREPVSTGQTTSSQVMHPSGRHFLSLHFSCWLLLLVGIPGGCVTALRAQPSGAVIGPATVPVPASLAGELLLSELNCIACHQAD